MQLLVLVLNQTEHLEHLLSELAAQGIRGATVLSSTGMARILCEEEDSFLFGGLRSILNPERKTSKTLFIVLSDEQVQLARSIVNQVTGGFDKPDTGIMFSVPTLLTEGLDKHQ